jgi:hypothetical protein
MRPQLQLICDLKFQIIKKNIFLCTAARPPVELTSAGRFHSGRIHSIHSEIVLFSDALEGQTITLDLAKGSRNIFNAFKPSIFIAEV